MVLLWTIDIKLNVLLSLESVVFGHEFEKGESSQKTLDRHAFNGNGHYIESSFKNRKFSCRVSTKLIFNPCTELVFERVFVQKFITRSGDVTPMALAAHKNDGESSSVDVMKLGGCQSCSPG